MKELFKERNKNHIDFEVSKLISGYIAGTISDEEKARLLSWLETPKNKDIFDSITSANVMMEKIERYKSENVYAAYNSFVQRRIKENRKTITYRGLVAAAVLIPLIIAGYLFIGVSQQNNMTDLKNLVAHNNELSLSISDNSKILLSGQTGVVKDRHDVTVVIDNDGSIDYSKISEKRAASMYHILEVPSNHVHKITLSDGSKVWINSLSAIRYPVLFRKNEREVEVTGEAYFEVQPDSTRPFYVVSNGVRVMVTGTSFNVHNYQNDDYFHVTVASGSVIVRTGSKDLALNPGQQAYNDKESGILRIKPVMIDEFVSWKDGIYIFRESKLAEVLKRAERWFGVDFIFENKNLEKLIYTGVLLKEDRLDDFLGRLEETSPCRFKKENNKIIIN